MSNEVKHTDNEREGTAFESIKALNSLVSGEGELFSLQRKLREARKQAEVIYRDIKTIESQRQEAKRAERAKIAEAKAKLDEDRRKIGEESAPEVLEKSDKNKQKSQPASHLDSSSNERVAEQGAPIKEKANEGGEQQNAAQKAQQSHEKRENQRILEAQRAQREILQRNQQYAQKPYEKGQNRQGQGGYGDRRGGYGGNPQGQGGYGDRKQHNNNNNAGGFNQGRPPYQQRPFDPNKQGSKPPFEKRQQQGASGARPFEKRGAPSAASNVVMKPSVKSFDNKRKDNNNKNDEKKALNKRALIRRGFVLEDLGEERMVTRKLKNKKNNVMAAPSPVVIEKAIITTENLTVKLLSEKIGKPAAEILKKLMLLGIMTNINSVVDFPTMELVASEFGVEIELKLDKTKEEELTLSFEEDQNDGGEWVKRPPIVTVMGHVDHGKTSLLDRVRKTSIASGEAGGITQHIGAYTVTLKGERITFIDTPGHEAFTAMRARGAKLTDIAILVVAADDGIMPQTVEAIDHAKAANVPIIVAINKIDKQGAAPEKVIQRLTEYGLVCEEWGGQTMMVKISAKTGEGIDNLLESILLLAEVMELKADNARRAKGTIVEARLDKGKGPVATVVIQNGTLRVGDYAVSGMTYGRIRAMHDDKGRSLKEADPSTVVSILGFSDVPNAGDLMYVVEEERFAKQVTTERSNKIKAEQLETNQSISLDDVFNKIKEGKIKGLNVVLKADTQGSVEAIKASLSKLNNEEVRVNVIHGGVGAINKSDIMLSEASGAIVLGFNVRPDNETRNYAEANKIDIRLYRIIYELLEDIEDAMKGMLEPKFREQIVGHAEVRNTFKITGAGTIAGLMVTSGKIIRSAKVRVVRENIVLYEGSISTLKRFKDDVREVAAGYECGLGIEGFNNFKDLDQIECFSLERLE